MPDARRYTPEIVAPAGSPDAAYAALEFGADAVYAGLGKFSARAGAPNFTFDELDELVAYARSLSPPRRVFVVLNTLVLDRELENLVATLERLESTGVDAVVVQDLGVARVARRHFPALRLHASTQMAVHGRAGVEAAGRMGFARVILARELTLDEVRDCAAVGGPEIEVFVHGALCYSYSGRCLFSSHALGRSGNRGTCAQPCRTAFMVGDAGTKDATSAAFPFSMKDLALVDWTRRLADAGVAALKIEGRMRSPLYVAAATDLYRRILDGRLAAEEQERALEDMKTIFSRPWTDFHLGGRASGSVTDPDVTGHRGARIGKVETVVMPGSERRAFLRFRTSRRIELRDGLQVEPPDLDRPFGFPVERMRVVVASRRRKTRDAFEAPAGSTVEVELPEEYPLIPPGTPVCCASSQEVKQRFRWSRPAPGRHRMRRAADFVVEVSSSGIAVTARTDAPSGHASTGVQVRVEIAGALEPARDAGRTESAARKAFAKLGDTAFELRSIEVRNPDGSFAPVAALNAARREAADALSRALDDVTAARVAEVVRDIAPRTSGPTREGEGFTWSVKTDRVAHLTAFEADDWRDVLEVTIDVSRDSLATLEDGLARIAEEVGNEHVRLALPAISRAWETPGLRERVSLLRDAGWQRWEVSCLGGWALLGMDPSAPDDDVDLSTDWPLYVTNREAARALLDAGASAFTLSPEDGLANWRGLLDEFGARAVVVVYQDTPLLISETRAFGGASPDGTRLISSFGDRLRALDVGGRTVVVAEAPLCLSGALQELAEVGAVSLRADFVWRAYPPEVVRERWRAVRSGATVPGARVANLRRGLA
jgi:putative protease